MWGLYHKSKNQVFIKLSASTVIPADAEISSGSEQRFLNAPKGASASGMTPLRFVRNDTHKTTTKNF